MANRLPKFYIIQQVNDPRWGNYIKHLNITYGKEWDGLSVDNFYGYNGGYQSCRRFSTDFINNPTILTLDQFEEMTFELPAKWYVIRNAENAAVLNEWNNKKYKGSNAFMYSSGRFYSDKDHNDVAGATIGYTEITFKQFQDHVLQPVVEFVVPENWYIRGSAEFQKWCNDQKPEIDIAGNNFAGFYRMRSYPFRWEWSNTQPTIAEITFDQFIKYIAKPVVPAFNKDDWNIEVDTEKQFNEVCAYLNTQSIFPSENYKQPYCGFSGGSRFINWNGKTFGYDNTRERIATIEKAITWEQFQSFKIPITMSTTQTISRENLEKLYNQVCDGWQSFIRTEMSGLLFATEFTVKNEVITKAFGDADSTQKALLLKYFKLPVEDKNVFPVGITSDLVEAASQLLFNNGNVLQLINGMTPSAHPELEKRAFLVSRPYTVTTGITDDGTGTWISIHKK